MSSLLQRAGGSLAVKTLPAIYGVGLILLVVRVIPLSDFGRYGMAIAYVNLFVALSRGLWGGPLIMRAARGDRDSMLGPAFWLTLSTACVGAVLAFVILPLLNVGWLLTGMTAVMLFILVPRDIALSLAQASSRVWAAFTIESGYFIGGLCGFAVLSLTGNLKTAESVMLVNIIAAVISAVLGIVLEPSVRKPGTQGDWKNIVQIGRWIGLLTLGEVYLQQGDALLVGIFFSAEAIAPYIAARTLLRMYTLLSQSVNFLVLPYAARLHAGGQTAHLRKRVRTVLKLLIIGLIPVNVLIWLICPWIFPLVLGQKYVAAIPFFRWMILATFLEPVYSVLTNAVTGIGKPREVVPVQYAGLILSVVANLLLLPIAGLKAAAFVLVLTYATLAGGMYRLARKYLVADPDVVDAAKT